MLEIGTQILATAAGLILVFGVVVVIHELGHYWAGRISGAKIESFSVGFGKSLVERKDKHGTRWRINILPFGGFVAFVSRNQAQKNPNLNALKGLAYEDVGPWKRNFISVAGPAANFVFAIFLFAGLSLWSGVTTAKVMIGEVDAGMPADLAGLQYADHVISANGEPLGHPVELLQTIRLSADEPISMEIARGGEVFFVAVTPGRKLQENALGQSAPMGFIGANLGVQDLNTVTPSLPQALYQGVDQTRTTLISTVSVIRRIIMGKDSVHMMTGPIGIGDAARRVYVTATETENVSTEQRVNWTFTTLIHLCALISIGIGFFNILPFPILDGGHVVINTYEAITGSMMPEIVQDYAMRFGLFCLVGLFAIISFGDLREVGLFG